jgi:hypothetical protein
LTPDSKLMAVRLKLGADSVEALMSRKLFAVPAEGLNLFPYEVARDGQRFLVATKPSQAAEPLSVIVNWHSLVKRGAPAP